MVGAGALEAGDAALTDRLRSKLADLAAAGAEVAEVAGAGPDALDDALRFLEDLGITGEVVLVIGTCPAPGPGPSRTVAACLGPAPHDPAPGTVHAGTIGDLEEILDRQAARRRARRVPHIDPDPGWTVRLPAGAGSGPLAESLGCLSNGRAATRAALEEGGPGSAPLLIVGGVYDRDDRLLPGPVWTAVDLPVRGEAPERILDMRRAVLGRRASPGCPVRSLRLVSGADPAALAMRCEVEREWPAPGPALRAPPGAGTFRLSRRGGTDVAVTGVPAGGATTTGAAIAVAARDVAGVDGAWSTLERLAAWAAVPAGDPPEQPPVEEVAAGRLEAQARAGFDALLSAHRRAWADKWRGAGVSIEGSPDDELAARFAVFHLLGAASGPGGSAVGPRGLTGDAYAGHVFWDADVFVLPALAALDPGAARSILEYRIRRLPAARRAARAAGLAGARFPWESAGDGTDVTPRWVRGRGGPPIPIATGHHELHIVADVAWAACRYADWTGDRRFLTSGPGRDLIVDTARFWASRIRTDRSGRGHIYGVMGPDEYHEAVDDNAFTNVMARWNLQTAARLVGGDPTGGSRAEADRWRALADGLVDGWDPELDTFEQFAGYYDLERLTVAEVAAAPVAMDLVLGQQRVAGSQLIKQADVLMLHHMVPEQVPAGSLAPSLDYYGPRTAHGSSLSPAVHASLLARAGRGAEALGMLRLAARLDLDDVTGTSASGLHLATMGGVWQALAYGFMGMRAEPGCLALDPRLPAEWSALTMRFRMGGTLIEVRADGDGIEVRGDRPVTVRVGDAAPTTVGPPGGRLGPAGVDPAHRDG